MIDHLADTLLCRICHPVTAVVSMDEHDHVLGVILIDTLFAAKFEGKARMIAPNAQWLAVVFGHPDGRLTLEAEESEILRSIGCEADGLELRAYIAGEDIGCFEVDSSGADGYNGEKLI